MRTAHIAVRPFTLAARQNAALNGHAPQYIAGMKSPPQRGFTIYELLITLLIVGVVLTLGIPSFGEFTKNSRISSTVNDLHSSFMLGRSEAARSKSNITICASPNPLAGAAAACGGVFDQGWIIFEDTDGDIVRDPGESLLRAHPPLPDGLNIIPDNGANYFSFAATGLGRGDINGNPAFVSATICDARGTEIAAGGSSAARRLVVTPIGRATIIRDKDIIDASGGCP
jgi:type IV fimbrial biogenesis protein FimT